MKKIFYIMLILTFISFLTSCKKNNDSNGLKKVTVILDYVPNTNHTGLYVAKELGFFEAEGLSVELLQPSEGASATLIATGKGDFGISYQEDVTYARTSKDPLPIKAIAAVLQHNTSGFASYAPKNILSPKDFENKIYVGWGSPAEEAIVKSVMKRNGADPETLKIVNFGDEDFFSIAKDKVDVSWIFYAWAGIQAEKENFPINYLPIIDLYPELDFYTPVIIASEDTINNNSELCKKFLSAVSKGYNYAAENPEKSAEIFSKAVPEYDKDFILMSQKWISKKYIDDSDRWGVMEDSRWDSYTKFMMDNKLIDKDMISTDAFTNDFLPNN